MMAVNFSNKKILLGICGGISAYKSVELARRLMKHGAEVQVVMTEAAKAFIRPLSFEAITQKKVSSSLFECENPHIEHIERARFPELIIIAPATAHFIAQLAAGLSDDLLSAICLATQAPICVVPAMNKNMWANPATQGNVETLKKRGLFILPVASGEQACGDVGLGRMLEPEEVIQLISERYRAAPYPQDFKEKRVMITVGSTREAIDPVRYIGNRSSGKMGFALAEAFAKRGAHVSLVCGHCEVTPPDVDSLVHVQTAEEMLRQVMRGIHAIDIFIGSAAVADYRPKTPLTQKLKSSSSKISLEFEKNPDILSTVTALAKKPITVGFALETEDLLKHAKAKLTNKKLDMMIANSFKNGFPFGADENEVFILTKGQKTSHPLTASKKAIAEHIIDGIAKIIYKRK